MGMIWGAGHSVSSFLLGALAFAMLGQSQCLLNGLASCGELLVGLSFLVIGSLSLRETMQLGLGFGNSEKPNASSETAKVSLMPDNGGDDKASPIPNKPRSSTIVNANPRDEETSPASLDAGSWPTTNLKKAGPEQWRMVLLNGAVHGLSLDGAPSLIPALAFGTWHKAFIFLVAYCVGTIGAMAGATFGVGESSQWLSKRTMRPELILRRLSAASALLAISMGFVFSSRGLAATLSTALAR
jgi:hypothetical protein